MAKDKATMAAAKAVKATAKDVDVLAGVTIDPKLLGKMVQAIATASAAQRERVRFAAVSAIEYAIHYGNANFLTSIYEAIGSESRRNSYIKWVMEFAPARWIEGKVDKAAGTKELGKFGIDTKRIEEFKAQLKADRIGLLAPLVKLPYWEFDKEPPFSGFSLRAQIASAIKRAASIMDDDEKAKHEGNDFDGLEDLAAWAAKYPPKVKAKKAGAKGTAATMH